MKRFVFVIVVTLMAWPVAAAADFQAGVDAAQRGDYATAFREFKSLAEQGDTKAQYYLGVMYTYGNKDVPQDSAEAVKWLSKSAVQGHTDAQIMLGVLYSEGRGVAKDVSEAARWFSKVEEAAHQGIPEAQFYLGVMYRNGYGVAKDKDMKEAVRWSRKAAEQGNAEAQTGLGKIYLYGRGVPVDVQEGMRWLNKAAEQGFAGAQLALALTYSLGSSVPADAAKTAFWYRKAAELGNVVAQTALARMYEEGLGVGRSHAMAASWYRKAAEQGWANAQIKLGYMYAEGRGVPQNYAQAYSWFSLAAAQGYATAIKGREIVAGRMTPAQIAEGQRMARNWRLGKKVAKPQPSPSAPQPVTMPAPQVAMAGLQRQLAQIKGLLAKKPAAKPKPASKFPTSPVAVSFARVNSRPDDIAVIIGNADYSRGRDIPDVTPAYADANGIKQYVTQALGIRAENIIFLKDASQAEMISTFGSETNPNGQLFNYVKPGKSRVFVYYSGHGAPGGKDGDSYIVPSNAQASTIELNGYQLKTLYKNLSKIPAKSITVVLEACFSGASQSGTVINKASPIYLKAKNTGVPPNITLIAAGAAGAANQIASWEQDESSGLFTEYFLKGMSGKADAKPYGNSDGKVEYAELGRYLKGTMSYFARRYYGREQTAQIVVGN